ncbi:MAG: NAD(P)/FAD-dependent oxidoreductase [Dethiobacteraceae bacterium]|nr:NAD(P)/FAD-dependent oxidoreductase [Bacillota bacterium]
MGCKVAVIGAGPGGLSAAREACAHGLDVTLFEKAGIGENISCAEGFFDLLKMLAPPTAGICFPVTEIIFSVIDTFVVDSSSLNIWMIDRSTWQKSLAAAAVAEGCQLVEYFPVTPQVYQRLEREYDWIIDASGVRPLSGKIYSLPTVRTAPTAQYTIAGDFARLQGKIKVVADPGCRGYGWIFPKSDKAANVGLAWFGRRKEKRRLHAALQQFIAQAGLQANPVLHKAGGPIPISRRPRLVYGKTLLVGDAAGLCSPLHGGGIDTACISGILAARAIACRQTEQYEQSVEKIIGARLKLEQKICAVWENSDLQTFNDLLALAFGSGKPTGLQSLLLTLTQEAAILSYVQSGKMRADWEKGLITEGLPLLAKIFVRVMAAKCF